MKLIRVDMRERTIMEESVPEAYAGLGGRGLTAAIISAEVPPSCDPLGPENKLVIAPGLLSGTRLANTSRVSIGAKSPLTGTIKESNAGGAVAHSLGRLGITGVVIEKQAPGDELWILHIDENGQGSLVDARDQAGMGTYALSEILLDRFGKDNSILCVGPAGEKQRLSASIQATDVDDRPCRAAGRGGLGAVMGTRGVKGVVISTKGKSPDALADPEAFTAASKDFAKAIMANPFSGQVLPNLGTAGVLGIINNMGAFPCYNATKGQFPAWEKICGETMTRTIQERGGNPKHKGCAGCIVHCSNVYVDQAGKYITSSLEYETIWALGGMTGVADMDAIAQLDRLCDDIGVDTMNTGVAVAVAMDAGYREFGDAKAALEMVAEIRTDTHMGRLIGDGPDAVGRHFNHPRVPTVKGQSIAAYDPRAQQGTGVTYATSPMGADHTAGNVLGEYMAGTLDPTQPDGQVAASRNTQVAMAFVDCTGLCILAALCLQEPEAGGAFITALNAKLGTQMGPEAIPAMGVRVLQMEREFNRNAGLSEKDDRLPSFFLEEPLAPHDTVFAITTEELDGTLAFG